MFKKTMLVSAAILATVALAGCGNNTSQNAVSTPPATQTQQATSGISLPGDKPAYTGKVIDVANDKLTINKAELPAQPQAAPQGTPQGGQAANGKEQGQGRGIKFSDQADTITIPAGAQVVAGGPRGGNLTAIKVSDIKKGQIIRVWEKDGAITFVQVTDANRDTPRNGSQNQQRGQQPAGGGNNQVQ